jgi:hypothetical protein
MNAFLSPQPPPKPDTRLFIVPAAEQPTEYAFVHLPCFRTGRPALFAVADLRVYEVTRARRDFTSAFIGNSFVPDGAVAVLTPCDVALLVLHLMQRLATSTASKLPLDDYIDALVALPAAENDGQSVSEAFPALEALLRAPHNSTKLQAFCECVQLRDDVAIRFSAPVAAVVLARRAKDMAAKLSSIPESDRLIGAVSILGTYVDDELLAAVCGQLSVPFASIRPARVLLGPSSPIYASGAVPKSGRKRSAPKTAQKPATRSAVTKSQPGIMSFFGQ